MFMRALSVLLAVAWAMVGTATAQDDPAACDIRAARLMHAFSGGIPKKMSFARDSDAADIVIEILKQHGLPHEKPLRYDILITEDDEHYPNAHARYCAAEKLRQIIFNRVFVERTREKAHTNWVLLGIAAHEVGHHVSHHLDGEPIDPHKAELESDQFAGFTLARMGASYDDTVAAIVFYPGPNAATDSHPARRDRLTAMASGWREASGKPLPVEIEPRKQEREEDALKKFDWKYNRDIFGEDIVSTDGRTGIPGVTLEQCAAACDGKSACVAFSFDRWNGRCFLKDKIVQSLLDPTSVLGVKKPAELPRVSDRQADIRVIKDKIFKDKPVLVRSASTLKECQQICHDELRCVAFSFLKAEKKCNMFNQSAGYYADEAADSGYKYQRSGI